MYRILFALLVCCIGCELAPTEKIEPACFAPGGEYVGSPYLEINGCSSLVQIAQPPDHLWLDTNDLSLDLLSCGDYVILDEEKPYLGCNLHQLKTLDSSEKGFEGTLRVEMRCEEFTCMSYWSIKFRRLEDLVD